MTALFFGFWQYAVMHFIAARYVCLVILSDWFGFVSFREVVVRWNVTEVVDGIPHFSVWVVPESGGFQPVESDLESCFHEICSSRTSRTSIFLDCVRDIVIRYGRGMVYCILRMVLLLGREANCCRLEPTKQTFGTTAV
ncbi:unnamed protein product [Adineta ricciae]|uniref:Uncharacterized protein n=1 Tax=Adineta ricciae TaxID=249248 RepID=A0A816FEB7_ADIRI|nr:unnamed protein product [Adineta ricciae]CAF1660462.1 unnamed protein product [Adineta ricciae]